jgi:hypothetical protein
MQTRYAPGSIGLHVERTDCKFTLIHVIGYETGIRSDASSNWFSQIHVWKRGSCTGADEVLFPL